MPLFLQQNASLVTQLTACSCPGRWAPVGINPPLLAGSWWCLGWELREKASLYFSEWGMWARLMESFVDNGSALESVQNWNLGWIRHRWLLYLFFSGRSVQFSLSVVSDFLQPHGLKHTSLSITNSSRLLKLMSLESVMPSSHLISVIPFSCLQSFPASGSFPMSQFFASGGQSIGVSASTSVLPMNVQDWFPLRLTGWISLQSKGLSRVFSNTTAQKHQFFGVQPSL